MKNRKWFFLLVIATLLIVSACSGGNGGNTDNQPQASNDGPAATADQNGGNAQGNAQGDTPSAAPTEDMMYGPYPETVTFSTILGQNPQNKFPDGATYENNPYKDYLEKTLNVKEEFKWKAPVGDGFDNKFQLMIASNDLPDIFYVQTYGNLSGEAALKQLATNGMIEPLDDVYAQYADPAVKDIYQAVDDGGPLKKATFDGKLMAIPYSGDVSTSGPMLWVRQDWLDKLNLPVPKTIDDVVATAKAFVEQDPDGNGKKDTYGLGINKDVLAMQNLAVNPVFWNTGGSTTWIERDGKIVYGPAQPENKAGLQILQDMFKQGLIDPEFYQRGGNEYVPMLSSDKMGLFFGVFFAPAFPLQESVKNNPNADWRAYPIANDQGEVVAEVGSYTTSYLVVRKGFKHPELAVKMLNLSYQYNEHQIPDLYELDKTTYNGMTHAFNAGLPIATAKTGDALVGSKKILDAVDGKGDPAQLKEDEKQLYDTIMKEKDSPRADIATWMTSAMQDTGMRALINSNLKYVYTAFTGATETMASQWTNLQTELTKTYTDIILNRKPVDYFDTWAAQWKSQGGDKITEEVNAAVQVSGQ